MTLDEQQNQIMEKYASLWNSTYWQVMHVQENHPEADHEDLLRETVFEMEIMERRMLDLIPDSYIKSIYDLCAPI